MKRILALEGGGVRAFISIQILTEVEAILRKRTSNPDYRLSEHFDLIAGTSAGAIIAALLSWGLSMDEVQKNYSSCIKDVFKPAPFYRKHLYYQYTDKYISATLQRLFKEDSGQDATFGSDHLKTLLLLVIRNATTGSPWPLCNNPDALFNQRTHEECNLDLPLWQLVRASSAAPTYFPSENIKLSPENNFEFIDGGISPYNNPSFMAYQTATLPEYNLAWETGEDKLFLLSVGAGQVKPEVPGGKHYNMHKISHAKHVIKSLMYSASVQQDLACRTVGKTIFGPEIDSELKERNDPSFPPHPCFSYTRYDRRLRDSDLKGVNKKDAKKGFELDNLKLIKFYEDLGEMYVEQHVSPNHIL